MPSKIRTFIIWLFLTLLIFGILSYRANRGVVRQVNFEDFVSAVHDEDVSEVRIENNQIFYKIYQSDEAMQSLGVLDDKLRAELSEQGVFIQQGPQHESSLLTLESLIPIVILFGAFYFFFRRLGGNGGNIYKLRNSTAQLLDKRYTATFKDVGGCQEAKVALADVVSFLSNAKQWQASGARLPRGVLLDGPPGCGKSLIARAVAGESKAKFYALSASEFVEMFVGVGAARVRDTFEIARKNAPAVIFIDELDAVGRRRGSGIGAGHDEREQTLNQLLVCMDGSTSCDNVVVLAATNRADVLDRALLRKGRFDRVIKIEVSTYEDRKEIIDIHARNKSFSQDVNLDQFARMTEGYSGADLESVLNEAALISVRENADSEVGKPISIEQLKKAVVIANSDRKQFNRVDVVMIESATQLAESSRQANAQVLLSDGTTFSGQMLWANANFIKMRLDDSSEVLLGKTQVLKIVALGTPELVGLDSIDADLWANKPTGVG